jgi:hypothetical protein
MLQCPQPAYVFALILLGAFFFLFLFRGFEWMWEWMWGESSLLPTRQNTMTLTTPSRRIHDARRGAAVAAVPAPGADEGGVSRVPSPPLSVL